MIPLSSLFGGGKTENERVGTPCVATCHDLGLEGVGITGLPVSDVGVRDPCFLDKLSE